MRTKTIFILCAILIVLSIVGYVLFQSSLRSEHFEKLGTLLFGDLPTQGLAIIQIEGRDGKVTIEKGEKTWKVKDKYNYKADLRKIRELIIKLKELKVGREFKGNKSIYERLSLFPPGNKNVDDNIKATRILIKTENGKTVVDLLVGKLRIPEEQGISSSGQYVRFTGTDNIFLIDQPLTTINYNPKNWLDTKILEVRPEEIKRIAYYGKDGKELFSFVKKEKNSKFEASGPISGKEINLAKLSRLSRALSSLQFIDILSPGTDPSSVGITTAHFDFELFNGLIYQIYTAQPQAKSPEKYYLKVKARTLNNGSNSNEKEKQGEEIQNEADKVDRDIGKWIYVVSKWVYEAFEKNPDKFLNLKKPDAKKAKKT